MSDMVAQNKNKRPKIKELFVFLSLNLSLNNPIMHMKRTKKSSKVGPWMPKSGNLTS